MNPKLFTVKLPLIIIMLFNIVYVLKFGDRRYDKRKRTEYECYATDGLIAGLCIGMLPALVRLCSPTNSMCLSMLACTIIGITIKKSNPEDDDR